ncbi:MAG: DegT/DnrJ/EryC1/StrS family aminotransferase [Anaerolineae bacterium]|nr:DegT/DnrJ/EryC1/StrS family aminotransferase [Anaerolineae bacterium]
MLPLNQRLSGELHAAVDRVLDSGWYILGPEVEAFEREFAAYHSVGYAVGVANGTDAIELALRAAGVGRGDEVITVAHTAVPTVCAVERAGASPVLVDIDPTTYTIDPAAVEAAITPRTKAILPVHLYGHPADLNALVGIAQRHKLLLVEDCAQAHGARDNGRLVGTFGDLAAFSFYPTKNLGAYGDGGAVITSDPQLAERLKRLRNYGQVRRYHHAERGMNSRLDEMQAALLRVKLQHLDAINDARREIAAAYDRSLRGVTLPTEQPNARHVYHLYVVRHAQRDPLAEALRARGVETLVHYPIPVHLQAAYADLGYGKGSLPVTEQIAQEILSLPLYYGLTEEQIAVVAEAVDGSLKALASV